MLCFFVINCIQCVFKKLIDNKFDLNQLYANCKFSLSLVSRISRFAVAIRLVSSAKRINVVYPSMAKGRSLIYNRNNRGPNTEP
jgi:hypothetical protein